MDFQLSNEQKPISETAREFADREILPRPPGTSWSITTVASPSDAA